MGKRKSGTKLSIYIPGDLVDEMRAQAKRTDRSVSWLIRRAWLAYHEQAKALPTQGVRR